MHSGRDGLPGIYAAGPAPNHRPDSGARQVSAASVLAVSIRAWFLPLFGFRRVSGECQIAGVAGGVTEGFLDPQ